MDWADPRPSLEDELWADLQLTRTRLERRTDAVAYGKLGWKASQEHAARVRSRQRARCDECGRESTPAGIGAHQRWTGHVGRTRTEDPSLEERIADLDDLLDVLN